MNVVLAASSKIVTLPSPISLFSAITLGPLMDKAPASLSVTVVLALTVIVPSTLFPETYAFAAAVKEQPPVKTLSTY